VITHQVRYRLLDHDFDAASEDMTSWYGAIDGSGGWLSRWPVEIEGIAPVNAQPAMEVLPPRTHRPETWDEIDVETGWIKHRRQNLALPTIERGRLADWPFPEIPFPPLSAAFMCQAVIEDDDIPF
jgi:hypothetical protein